jgi:hypothetical protein
VCAATGGYLIGGKGILTDSGEEIEVIGSHYYPRRLPATESAVDGIASWWLLVSLVCH